MPEDPTGPPLWARSGVVLAVIGVAGLVLAMVAVDVTRQMISAEGTAEESAPQPAADLESLADDVPPLESAPIGGGAVVVPGDPDAGPTTTVPATSELASSSIPPSSDATSTSSDDSSSGDGDGTSSSTTAGADLGETTPGPGQTTTTSSRSNLDGPGGGTNPTVPWISITTKPPTTPTTTPTTRPPTTRKPTTTRPATTRPPTTRRTTTTTRPTTTTQRPTTTTTEPTTTTHDDPGHGHAPEPGSWVRVQDERASYNDSTVSVTHHLFDFRNSSNPPAGWGASRIGFLVHCEPVMTAQIDPIVNPGHAKSGHLHEFFGNPNVTPHTSTQSLADTPRSQIDCTDKNDKSAYWSPTAYQNGNRVKAHHFKAYYKSPTPDAVPMPFGLRMIAGNAVATKNQPSQVGWWYSGSKTTQNSSSMVSRPNANTLITLRMNFPNCWDGKHLDSPDHQSHVAYARGGKCPSSHPVKIPQLVTFTDYRTSGGAGFSLASGSWYTFHQDFWNAWSPTQMEALTKRCIEAEVNCRARRSPDLVPRGQHPIVVPR